MIDPELQLEAVLSFLPLWRMQHTGIVDQRVNPVGPLGNLPGRLTHRSEAGKIKLDQFGRSAACRCGLHVGLGFCASGHIAARHDDAATLARQNFRRLETDPAIGPCDDKGLPVLPNQAARRPIPDRACLLGHTPGA